MPFSRKFACCSLLFFVVSAPLAWTEETPKAEPTPGATQKSTKAAKADDQSAGINIAIPIHQPVKGLHLPFYDLTGHLKMQFDASTANRTSDNLVELTELKIETFDDKGKREMLVHFPQAIYDLGSNLITSRDSVEVRRSDFVLTGVGMEFDTKKHSGRVFSQIRMEIFNRSDESPQPTPTPNGP